MKVRAGTCREKREVRVQAKDQPAARAREEEKVGQGQVIPRKRVWFEW